MSVKVILRDHERQLLAQLKSEHEDELEEWLDRLASCQYLDMHSKVLSGRYLAHRIGYAAGMSFFHAECVAGVTEVLDMSTIGGES